MVMVHGRSVKAPRGPGWVGHLAKGWKGQRIAVFRDQDLVVTTTGCFEQEYDPIFDEIIRRYVLPAVITGYDAPRDAGAEAELATLLREVQRGPQRGGPAMEQRMVPSIEPKERHRRLDETL
jgi:hypothetical protein